MLQLRMQFSFKSSSTFHSCLLPTLKNINFPKTATFSAKFNLITKKKIDCENKLNLFRNSIFLKLRISTENSIFPIFSISPLLKWFRSRKLYVTALPRIPLHHLQHLSPANVPTKSLLDLSMLQVQVQMITFQNSQKAVKSKKWRERLLPM